MIMASAGRFIISRLPLGALVGALLIFAGVSVPSLHAQSASPGGKSPSPPPPTPEQRLSAARSAANRAQAVVKQRWTQLQQSRTQLAQAQKDFDAVIAELREETPADPVVRDAGVRVIEARHEMEKQQRRALSPLRLSFRFNRLEREHQAMAIELEDLMARRARAQADRLPFDGQKQARIGELSLDLLKLRDDLGAMEAELLDAHEGYQAASAALDTALDEAAQAMKASRELREGNPRKQAAHKAMIDAYADALAKGKAYADARRLRESAANTLVALQQQNQRPGR